MNISASAINQKSVNVTKHDTQEWLSPPLNPSAVLNLSCWGNLTWDEIQPGQIVHDEIWVMNSGESNLEWTVTEWPSWGLWDFGSFFPMTPPGGLWVLSVNVTAPFQENETFTGHVKVMNTDNASDFAFLNTSLTTTHVNGYNVSENLVGFIRNLEIGENTISFQIIIGIGIRIIEYDDGGIVAYVVPYLFLQIFWSNDVIFEGILRSHFIKGTVRYRVDYDFYFIRTLNTCGE